MKIRLIFSAVGKPRGRGRIERFFETINQRFLCLLPGYAPAGHTKAKPMLRLNELDQLFKAFVINDYLSSTHSATGVAPLMRWQENGFLPQLPESLEQLDLLLLTVLKPRRVHQDGIRFQSLRYIDPILAAHVGESVTIRYDPRDMAEIRVFYQDRFLCRAVCQELAGETVTLKQIVAARNQRRKELKDQLKHRKSLIDALLGKPETDFSVPETVPTTKAAKKQKLKRYFNE